MTGDTMVATVNGQSFPMRIYTVVRPVDDPSQFEVVLVPEANASLRRKDILAIGRAATLDAAVSNALARVWIIQ